MFKIGEVERKSGAILNTERSGESKQRRTVSSNGDSGSTTTRVQSYCIAVPDDSRLSQIFRRIDKKSSLPPGVAKIIRILSDGRFSRFRALLLAGKTFP